MKKYSIIAYILMTMIIVGCSTWQNNVGKTLATTATTVDAAMKGWATYVAANKVSDDTQNQVRSFYSKYQLAMSVAKQAYGSAIVAGNQSLATQAVSDLTANAGNLTTAVTQFEGVK